MSSAASSPRIVIIGSGFGGLGMAAELLSHGLSNLTILEKANRLGGVWRDNTYPNAACDVPSSLYSWSFAPNPDWKRRYSGQADILAYQERVAADLGLTERIRFGTEIARADWDDTAAIWTLTTTTGETLEADFLIPAVGQLSRPVIPAIPGTDTFTGPAFHSAQWRHDVDLRGKRIAVLGTGASAIQFVPGIQPEAGHVTVFQRSAPYVVPKPDRGYTGLHQKMFSRLPASQAAGRQATMLASEQLNSSLTGTNPIKKALEVGWRALLRAQVKDPELRRKLTPDYPIGCKRLLFSNDWYPTLTKPNVSVVTEAVTEILPNGVRSADGAVHEVDVIIYGTGFAATEFLAPMEIHGAAGVALADVWADGARAYFGIAVPGFPNFGIVYGPNTNLGGSSIINMMEAQAGFIRQLVEQVRDGGTIEVTAAAELRFDAEIQQRLQNTVWAGCDSWYRDTEGRVTTNWPGTVTEYKRRTATPDLTDFTVRVPATTAS